MIVVTDTSVVLNLCCLHRENLLVDLFGIVLAPPAVAEEFQRLSDKDQRFLGLIFPTFIQITTPAKIPSALAGIQKLHAGEIDALSLAVETEADAVLMDERAGRSAAADLGLCAWLFPGASAAIFAERHEFQCTANPSVISGCGFSPYSGGHARQFFRELLVRLFSGQPEVS